MKAGSHNNHTEAKAMENSNKPGQVFLGNLASTLGIDQDTLVNGIKTAAGQTVARALQNSKITQQQADKLRTAIDGGTLLSGIRKRVRRFMLKIGLANALEMVPKDVASALRSGRTISDLAAGRNMTVAQVQATMLTNIKNRLDRAVQNGKLTQDQETRICGRIQLGIDSGNWVNSL
jgi:plasmid maintenance system antidote protein VapI